MSDHIIVVLTAVCTLCGYRWRIMDYDPPPEHCRACNDGKGHGGYTALQGEEVGNE